MVTYASITIVDAPRLTERKLHRAIERAALSMRELDVTHYAAEWVISGSSKYQPDGLAEIAVDLTTRHPGALLRIFQEWDDDESGSSLDIYQDGERQRDRCRRSELVPVDLHERVRAVRAALDGTGDLGTAARWLADGLDSSS